jgi:hypothetical protein
VLAIPALATSEEEAVLIAANPKARLIMYDYGTDDEWERAVINQQRKSVGTKLTQQLSTGDGPV